MPRNSALLSSTRSATGICARRAMTCADTLCCVARKSCTVCSASPPSSALARICISLSSSSPADALRARPCEACKLATIAAAVARASEASGDERRPPLMYSTFLVLSPAPPALSSPTRTACPVFSERSDKSRPMENSLENPRRRISSVFSAENPRPPSSDFRRCSWAVGIEAAALGAAGWWSGSANKVAWRVERGESCGGAVNGRGVRVEPRDGELPAVETLSIEAPKGERAFCCRREFRSASASDTVSSMAATVSGTNMGAGRPRGVAARTVCCSNAWRVAAGRAATEGGGALEGAPPAAAWVAEWLT
mmetsp:Transcript_24962/g.50157  ORF Transcript_24962/g.50157 Transcript_24962/m.50157 type:complete len:309 (+) Transcript_24962:602-1528(+)